MEIYTIKIQSTVNYCTLGVDTGEAQENVMSNKQIKIIIIIIIIKIILKRQCNEKLLFGILPNLESNSAGSLTLQSHSLQCQSQNVLCNFYRTKTVQ